MIRLPNHSALHQLMFSTVLLHWSLYAPLPPSQRITLVQWLEINAGFGGNGVGGEPLSTDEDPTLRMQRLIYKVINRACLPQLRIWPEPPPSAFDNLSQEKSGEREASDREGLASPAVSEWGRDGADAEETPVVEGWACLVGGALSEGASGSSATYRQVRSIHCEATATAWSTPANSRPNETPMPSTSTSRPNAIVAAVPYAAPDDGEAATGISKTIVMENSADVVWLCLRHSLLLFATKPENWAPYAFVSLSEVAIRNADAATLTVILGVQGDETGGDHTEQGHQQQQQQQRQLSVIFLLPDGRWQQVHVPQLEIRIDDSENWERWLSSLAEHCRVTRTQTSV